jgi:hypothetical protein
MTGILAGTGNIFVADEKVFFANTIAACDNIADKYYSIAGLPGLGPGQANRELPPCALM